MRLLLTLLLLLASLPVRAATGLSTPVFTNFFQEHFIVSPNAPPTQIIKSRIFGPATNIFNLTTNIYNNSYILYTNSDIFYGDVTLVVSNSIVTNINTTIVNDFTTNIIDNSVVIITNTTFIINGHTNDITQLWRTNAAGIYLPAITNTATIVVGQSAEAWWAPTLADGFVSIHDASVGDSQFNSLAIAAIDNVLQENYGTFTSTLGSGAAPAGAMQLLAATNWQNPAAPFSKFSVALQPVYGDVLLDLMNNGIHEFAVSNQITSVQALQLVPITNTTLALGANQINVQSNSFISLESLDPDPALTTISLSTGLRDGMVLLLKNVGVALGFTLPNGSPLYDDPTKFVTLPGGTWISTNYGDSMLLAGGLNGWTEVKRWGQNTNVQTEQLWELVGGHMRTVPDTLDDWQFRYGGVPQVSIYTNGAVVAGPNTPAFWGGPFTRESFVSQHDPFLGDPNFNELWVGTGPTFNDAGYLDFYCATNTANFWLYCITNGLGGRFSVALGYDVVAITSVIQGQNVFTSTPQIGGTVDDVSTNSTVFMDTTASVVNASLLDVRNAGTIKFKVSGDSGYTGTGTNWLGDDGKFHSTAMNTNGGNLSGTLTSPYYARASGADTLVDGALYAVSTNVALDGQFIFGPGTTNVLYRDGSHLVYTNGAANVDMQVINGSGKQGLFGINSGGQVEVRAGSGVNAVSLSDGTDVVTLFGGGLIPATTVSLGSQANAWASLALTPITKVQKTALSPFEGLIVMQSDNTPGLRVYQGGAWVMISTVADP